MTARRKNFSVVVHYPITDERAAQLRPIEYPSDCYLVGKYVGFRAAKAAYLRKNKELRGGGAYAAIVDLRCSVQLTPNRHGVYEGFE